MPFSLQERNKTTNRYQTMFTVTWWSRNSKQKQHNTCIRFKSAGQVNLYKQTQNEEAHVGRKDTDLEKKQKWLLILYSVHQESLKMLIYTQFS